MKKSLLPKAFGKLAAGFIAMALLLFVPAGTLRFFGGWLLMGLLFVPMIIVGIVLLVKNPELLEKRLSSKEQESAQKSVIAVSGASFAAGFIVAGLQFRFGWTPVPMWVTAAASVIFLLSYAMYAEVMRENAYLSRTVEVQHGQKVVSTGLYGVVRHPMYAAVIWLFLSMPLILGSQYAFLIFLLQPPVLVVRIINEEKVLAAELEGYTDYQKKVKYRLIPFVW